MTNKVEGNDSVGYRIVSEAGPLTGRKPSKADAYVAAGINPPGRKPAKKSSK